MEALRALAAKKAQEQKELAAKAGNGGFVSKAALEEARLKKIREEEAAEREERVSSNANTPWRSWGSCAGAAGLWGGDGSPARSRRPPPDSSPPLLR